METLGLWGDGDEIGALRDVERRFGVALDYTRAGDWFTAGDVFSELLKVLPESAAASTDTWRAFAEAISDQTGVNPLRVAPDTRLIDKPRRSRSLAIWIVAVAVGTAIALWLH